VTILSVEDDLGRVWWGNDQSESKKPVFQRPVISPQLAYLVTDVLKDEPARWLTLRHPNPLEIGRPVAAKIGQTLDQHDAWAIGYTPQLLVSAWVGGRKSEGQDNNQIVDSETAASLWNAVIKYASRDLPPDDWSVPAGVSRMAVCNPSGLLPSTECPDVVSEVFLNGTEPTQSDNLYEKIQINRETGRLATAFTPPELIEQRTYLVVPPEASEWARLASLPIPPVDFDIILSREESSPDVKITSPAMLAQVLGEIPILGSASGDDFAYYRLQYGKGLNPQEWIQIGNDQNTPVDEGELGTWDTGGLDGLYTLQLEVVREDQRVDNALAQVTVDNQPPQVEIISPVAGEKAILKDDQLILLVEASDNLAVQSVAFHIDGELVDLRSDPPYAVPWKASVGEHILRAIATDQAGNKSDAQSEFMVK
jgi:membrane carboxypeptidase/penicillin-binding protein PbpC